MPFITEEIWHYIAPRGAKDSIMVSRYAPGGVTPEQTACVERFELVKEIVGGIRNVRKTKNIAQEAAKPAGAAAVMVKTTEYFIPLGSMIDAEAERERLTKELDYARGFLASVLKKLSNERFVQNAPEQVVANERAKQADAQAKIKALEEQLAALE